MYVGGRVAARPRAVGEVEALAGAAAQQRVQGMKPALRRARRALGIDLLEAQHVRIEHIEDRPQGAGARGEPVGLIGRPVETFEVERREAQGHGARLARARNRGKPDQRRVYQPCSWPGKLLSFTPAT